MLLSRAGAGAPPCIIDMGSSQSGVNRTCHDVDVDVDMVVGSTDKQQRKRKRKENNQIHIIIFESTYIRGT